MQINTPANFGILHIRIIDSTLSNKMTQISWNSDSVYFVSECTPVSPKEQFSGPIPSGESKTWTVSKDAETLQIKCNDDVVLELRMRDFGVKCEEALGHDNVEVDFRAEDGTTMTVGTTVITPGRYGKISYFRTTTRVIKQQEQLRNHQLGDLVYYTLTEPYCSYSSS